METDALAVTSSSDVSETDGFASQVQVVAFNEVNEVDLAAPSRPLPMKPLDNRFLPSSHLRIRPGWASSCLP